MKTVIDPGNQLTFRPFRREIKQELESREGNKDFVHNLSTFVRVSCLQNVSYKSDNLTGKKNNLKDAQDTVLVDRTTFNGFQFVFDSNFDESYGEVQKIGQTLDGDAVRIKNPRRVPPPVLNTFTAGVGDSNNYFTTAQIQFTCNSLEQLQFLTPFLFNPGNTIFIEFGHNSDIMKNISLFDSDDVSSLVNSTIINYDCNSVRDSEDGFIERMTQRVFDSGGSYEFFHGIINNFNFTMNDRLGFDCTVDLISATNAKLKSPNSNSYTQVENKELENLLTTNTLESELKYFESTLRKHNELTEKDIIFSFSDAYTSTYVRFGNILSFLNGDYKIPVKELDITTEGPLSSGFRDSFTPDATFSSTAQDRLQAIRRENNLSIESPIQKTDITTLAKFGPRPVAKVGYGDSEPPAVSYSTDVLLFRKRMWSPVIKYNSEKGAYTIVTDRYTEGEKYIKRSVILQQDKYLEPGEEAIVTGNFITGTSQFLRRVAQEVQGDNSVYDVAIETIEPVLMEDNVKEDEENLHNIFINFDKFSKIYINSEGKKLDVMSKLKDLINDATDDIWDLSFMGEGVAPKNDETGECEKNVTTLIPLSVSKVDRTNDPYIFKVNSKESNFTGMDYGLGLEGLLGDQIYMNSINSSDGSTDSQKLNLLLFSNHENNLSITDYRNEAIRAARDEEEELRKDSISDIDDEGNDNDNNLLKEVKAGDVKKEFFSKGQLSKGALGEPNNNREFYNRIVKSAGRTGDNPEFTRLDDLDRLIVEDKTNEGGFVIPSPPQEIADGLVDLYGIQSTPLIFTPIKQTIRALRGLKTENIQSEKEKTTEQERLQQSRERSFKKGGINPLLESTLDITMPGIGGINPLEYAGVNGIPDVYAKRGQFCVMNVAHTVTPSNWTTQLTTRFRPTYEDE